MLEEGILAQPVQRLGTAMAPTVEDTPLQPALPPTARSVTELPAASARVINTGVNNTPHPVGSMGQAEWDYVPKSLWPDGPEVEISSPQRRREAEMKSRSAPCAGDQSQLQGDVISPARCPPKNGGLFERVEQRLESLGLRSRDVGGQGDCFFRALAAQHPELMHNPELHHKARVSTVKYLKDHEDKFCYAVAPMSYSDFLDRLSRPGTWVEGGVELLAAAGAWNVNIHIWGVDNEHDCRVLAPWQTACTRNVCMVHYHDQHYRVLERLTGEFGSVK